MNRDGKFVSGDGDVPLANVKMSLVGTDGMGGAVSQTTLTMADGMFWFQDVKPGSYSVSESTSTDTNDDGVADNLQDMVLDGTSVPVIDVFARNNFLLAARNFTHQRLDHQFPRCPVCGKAIARILDSDGPS